MGKPMWKKYFKEFSLKHFHSDKQAYLDAYEPHFKCQMDKTFTFKYEYTKADLITVCQSYFQEVRHLIKDETSDSKGKDLAMIYMQQFVDSLTN
jgi:hypothetical protein